MVTALSKQEQRILWTARTDGVAASSRQIEFDWRAVAKKAGIPAEAAPALLSGLRRHGFVGAIGPVRARLTEEGVEAATQLRN